MGNRILPPQLAVREDAYREVEESWRREVAADNRMRRLALRLGLVAVVLFVMLVISILVAWLLLT